MIRRASIAPIIALALMVTAIGVVSMEDDMSPRVACQLEALAAGGYRVAPHATDTTRRQLTLRLAGVDPATGGPDPSDWRAEFVDVRINGETGDVAIERVSVLRPDDADAPLHSPEAAHARVRVGAVLEAAAARCAP